jgi:hypothetical protein
MGREPLRRGLTSPLTSSSREKNSRNNGGKKKGSKRFGIATSGFHTPSSRGFEQELGSSTILFFHLKHYFP